VLCTNVGFQSTTVMECQCRLNHAVTISIASLCPLGLTVVAKYYNVKYFGDVTFWPGQWTGTHLRKETATGTLLSTFLKL